MLKGPAHPSQSPRQQVAKVGRRIHSASVMVILVTQVQKREFQVLNTSLTTVN